MALFNILIIGRSNVGKSTLFNRLLNRSTSIIDNNPGTTRDFKYVDFYLNDLLLRLYDTAGCDLLSPDSSFQKDIMHINENLLTDADLILFVVDSKNGLTSNDIEFAYYLKKYFFKTFLISNKHDSRKALEDFWEPLSLGLEYSFPISASHGLGIDDLKKEMLRFLKFKQPRISEDNESLLETNWNRKKNVADPYFTLINEKQLNSKNEPIKLAIVGRPNVGKSTLLNSIIKKQRVLTSSKSGTTTDPILVDFDWMGQEFRIIDTAGMRRSSKIQKGIEELSVQKSVEVIKFSEVVIMLLDIENALDLQDLRIINLIEKEGKISIGVNGNFVDLALDEVEITSQDIEGWLVANQGGLTVALDVVISEDLKEEGIARELINRIQNLRKDSGLDVVDKIQLTLQDSSELSAAVNSNLEYIKNETLTSSLTFVEHLDSGIDVEFDNIVTRLLIEKI